MPGSSSRPTNACPTATYLPQELLQCTSRMAFSEGINSPLRRVSAGHVCPSFRPPHLALAFRDDVHSGGISKPRPRATMRSAARTIPDRSPRKAGAPRLPGQDTVRGGSPRQQPPHVPPAMWRHSLRSGRQWCRICGQPAANPCEPMKTASGAAQQCNGGSSVDQCCHASMLFCI